MSKIVLPCVRQEKAANSIANYLCFLKMTPILKRLLLYYIYWSHLLKTIMLRAFF